MTPKFEDHLQRQMTEVAVTSSRNTAKTLLVTDTIASAHIMGLFDTAESLITDNQAHAIMTAYRALELARNIANSTISAKE